MSLFKIYYEETLRYEEFIEATNERQAANKFMMAIRDGELENYDGDIDEFDIEKQN